MKKIFVGLALIAIFFLAANWIVNDVERQECREWQKSSTTNWADWQKEQCQHHNLPLKK